jgi:hypothetical protein
MFRNRMFFLLPPVTVCTIEPKSKFLSLYRIHQSFLLAKPISILTVDSLICKAREPSSSVNVNSLNLRRKIFISYLIHIYMLFWKPERKSHSEDVIINGRIMLKYWINHRFVYQPWSEDCSNVYRRNPQLDVLSAHLPTHLYFSPAALLN